MRAVSLILAWEAPEEQQKQDKLKQETERSHALPYLLYAPSSTAQHRYDVQNSPNTLQLKLKHKLGD